jgi:predicted transcriptional regulator
VTADETPDELRARLDALAIAASRSPRTHPPTEEEQRAWEEFATAVLVAWPTIDALLARLTAAEADADRLAYVAEHPGSYPWVWSSQFGASVPGERLYRILRLHDEAVALRRPGKPPYPTDEMLEADAILDAGGELQ